MRKECDLQPITDPRAFVEELDPWVQAMSHPETRYQLHARLRDVVCGVDQEKAKRLGLSLPISSMGQAERTLRACVIPTASFSERGDETLHEVIEFEPTPVRYGGFADCVTHCLAWTDQGIFESGRYTTTSIADFSKTWQWFIHRRRMTVE